MPHSETLYLDLHCLSMSNKNDARLISVNSSPPGRFSCYFVVCRFFFQNQIFRKILSGIPSECQTDWIQIRPDICGA